MYKNNTKIYTILAIDINVTVDFLPACLTFTGIMTGYH